MPTPAVTKVERMARRLRGRYAATARLLEDALRGLSSGAGQGAAAASAARMLGSAREVDALMGQALAACGGYRAEVRRARRLLRQARADAAAADGPDAWRRAVGRWQAAEQLEARTLGRADAHLAQRLLDEVVGPLAGALQWLVPAAEEAARTCRAGAG